MRHAADAVFGLGRRFVGPFAFSSAIREAGDLMAIGTAVKGGFAILRRIARNAGDEEPA